MRQARVRASPTPSCQAKLGTEEGKRPQDCCWVLKGPREPPGRGEKMRKELSLSSPNPPTSWTGGTGGCRRQGSLLIRDPVPLLRMGESEH